MVPEGEGDRFSREAARRLNDCTWMCRLGDCQDGSKNRKRVFLFEVTSLI